MSPPRTARALAPALMAILALLWPTGATSAPPRDARSASPQAVYKASAVQATNSARLQRDLRALDADRCLQRFAVQQAAAMAQQESMYHQELAPIMRECGVDMVGENVAYGYATGDEVVDGWMNSPGHRANILNRGYRLLAVAARESASGRWYAAQVFGRR